MYARSLIILVMISWIRMVDAASIAVTVTIPDDVSNAVNQKVPQLQQILQEEVSARILQMYEGIDGEQRANFIRRFKLASPAVKAQIIGLLPPLPPGE